MTNPLLEARELTVSRGGEPLFEDLSFALEGGRVLTLTGPNGSGKTTLLRALCGLVQPDAGELLWRGEAIERSPDFKQNVTYVGHRAGLHGDLSAAENLDFLARVQATTTPSRVAPAFSRLDATRFAHQPLHSLSAGQQRRAALARLLLNDAVVWILDEPFSALDSAGRTVLEQLLTSHCSSGGMAIVATHHPLSAAIPGENLDLAGFRT